MQHKKQKQTKLQLLMNGDMYAKFTNGSKILNVRVVQEGKRLRTTIMEENYTIILSTIHQQEALAMLDGYARI